MTGPRVCKRSEVDWDPTEVNLEDYGVVEQPPGGTLFNDDPAHPESIACAAEPAMQVYNDGVAFEFPDQVAGAAGPAEAAVSVGR